MSFPDISEQHLIFFIARAETPAAEREWEYDRDI